MIIFFKALKGGVGQHSVWDPHSNNNWSSCFLVSTCLETAQTSLSERVVSVKGASTYSLNSASGVFFSFLVSRSLKVFFYEIQILI